MLRAMPACSVHTCVTSPPYFGLRDYDCEGQIGLEGEIAAYVQAIVEVFREVRRVLRDDGTVWLNLGDSYSVRSTYNAPQSLHTAHDWKQPGGSHTTALNEKRCGIPAKNRLMIPARVALALQADGWWLRDEIVWAKPNPMPSSAKDRTTPSHEMLYLLSKSPHYYFDQEAIKEPAVSKRAQWTDGGSPKQRGHGRQHAGFNGRYAERIREHGAPTHRNKRSVWTVPTRGFKGAHFATFPPALIEPCIKAGAPEGGTVLDPFGGSGTTGEAAYLEGFRCVLIEREAEYCDDIRARLALADAGTGTRKRAIAKKKAAPAVDAGGQVGLFE